MIDPTIASSTAGVANQIKDNTVGIVMSNIDTIVIIGIIILVSSLIYGFCATLYDVKYGKIKMF